MPTLTTKQLISLRKQTPNSTKATRKNGRNVGYVQPAREKIGNVLSVVIPIKLVSEANQRGNSHWPRTRRVKAQRMAVGAFLANDEEWLRLGASWKVTITRLGPGTLDVRDNLQGSAKAVIDEVARTLGVDDADERMNVEEIRQAKDKYGVVVVIERKMK